MENKWCVLEIISVLSDKAKKIGYAFLKQFLKKSIQLQICSDILNYFKINFEQNLYIFDPSPNKKKLVFTLNDKSFCS